MSGAINSDDDVDVFQFQVSESTLVAVGNFEEGEEGGLHPLVGNYFTIVDASEELVTRGFRSALVRLEAGTYYVKVDVWSLESPVGVRHPRSGRYRTRGIPLRRRFHFRAKRSVPFRRNWGLDYFGRRRPLQDRRGYRDDVIIDPQFDDVKTVFAWTHTYIPINVNLLDASGDPATVWPMMV